MANVVVVITTSSREVATASRRLSAIYHCFRTSIKVRRLALELTRPSISSDHCMKKHTSDQDVSNSLCHATLRWPCLSRNTQW